MKNIEYSKALDTNFTESIDNVKFALLEQGFSIVSEIDMKAKLKKRLDEDIKEYVILGVCDANLASKALGIEYKIGLLLPCNVIIYNKEGETIVSILLPTKTLIMVENDEIDTIAIEAENKLMKAMKSL